MFTEKTGCKMGFRSNPYPHLIPKEPFDTFSQERSDHMILRPDVCDLNMTSQRGHRTSRKSVNMTLWDFVRSSETS